jgi:hypothetical protein
MIAMNARNNDPGSIIRFNTLVKYSSIFSERIPGMDPPFSLMFFDISMGLSVTCV